MHIVPDLLLSKNKYLPSGETLAAISLAPEFMGSSSLVAGVQEPSLFLKLMYRSPSFSGLSSGLPSKIK